MLSSPVSWPMGMCTFDMCTHSCVHNVSCECVVRVCASCVWRRESQSRSQNTTVSFPKLSTPRLRSAYPIGCGMLCDRCPQRLPPQKEKHERTNTWFSNSIKALSVLLPDKTTGTNSSFIFGKLTKRLVTSRKRHTVRAKQCRERLIAAPCPFQAEVFSRPHRITKSCQ